MGKLPSSALRRSGSCNFSLSHTSITTGSTPNTLLSTSRPTIPASPCRTTQVRHATYVMRSRRPYQFTQLVQLSDGSTFTMRTTSPASLYKSTRDTRNHLLWQPSEKSLRNVELDEAGKLAAFRERFGRGWDLEIKPEEEDGADREAAAAAAETEMTTAAAVKGDESKGVDDVKVEEPEQDPFDSLADLISGYAAQEAPKKTGGLSAKEQAKKDKAKKKK